MDKELTVTEQNELERLCEARTNNWTVIPAATVVAILIVGSLFFGPNLDSFLVEKGYVSADFELDWGRLVIGGAIGLAPIFYAWNRYVHRLFRKRMGLDT